MEILSLRRQLAELVRSQALNTALIQTGLIRLQPDDPLLSQLFEVQDELYLEIRGVIVQLTGLDEALLEEFDRLLNEHRINIMLVSQTIRPLSGNTRALD